MLRGHGPRGQTRCASLLTTGRCTRLPRAQRGQHRVRATQGIRVAPALQQGPSKGRVVRGCPGAAARRAGQRWAQPTRPLGRRKRERPGVRFAPASRQGCPARPRGHQPREEGGRVGGRFMWGACSAPALAGRACVLWGACSELALACRACVLWAPVRRPQWRSAFSAGRKGGLEGRRQQGAQGAQVCRRGAGEQTQRKA